jgi:hypothetical protein
MSVGWPRFLSLRLPVFPFCLCVTLFPTHTALFLCSFQFARRLILDDYVQAKRIDTREPANISRNVVTRIILKRDSFLLLFIVIQRQSWSLLLSQHARLQLC